MLCHQRVQDQPVNDQLQSPQFVQRANSAKGFVQNLQGMTLVYLTKCTDMACTGNQVKISASAAKDQMSAAEVQGTVRVRQQTEMTAVLTSVKAMAEQVLAAPLSVAMGRRGEPGPARCVHTVATGTGA